MNWLSRLLGRASQDQRTQSVALAMPVWQQLAFELPFLDGLCDDDAARLCELAGRFLATKSISPAGGLAMDFAMRANIAVQACLPVLGLGLGAYPLFSEVIVYPGEFVVARELVDEAGVVTEITEPIAGESWDGGPVILSWEDASGTVPSVGAYNVVIHEFAHKLDMANGAIDGVPRFYRSLHGGLDEATWGETLDAALEDLATRIETLESSLPAHVDPESSQGERMYAKLPLDAYAATDATEFFSVASESFFVDPHRLKDAYPDLYAMLKTYYRQDPAARLARDQRASGAARRRS